MLKEEASNTEARRLRLVDAMSKTAEVRRAIHKRSQRTQIALVRRRHQELGLGKSADVR